MALGGVVPLGSHGKDHEKIVTPGPLDSRPSHDGSMGRTVYLPTNLVDFYGKCR